MSDWLDALAELRRQGAPAVLVTVLAARGSTPREAGCKMVVSADASFGTIGGGNLEYQSIRRARTLLAGAAPVVADFPLGPALGQCCGGHATILFDPLRPPSWRIAVYGAGHVGRALVPLLATLDCRIDWVDGRDGAFPAAIPANVALHAHLPPEDLPQGAHVLILTHDHALDYDLAARALPRGLAFVGVIGSQTKRARFVARLARQGVPDEAVQRLVCPIGLADTGGKAPAEIAIAVAAQLLQLRKPATISPSHAQQAPDVCGACPTPCATEPALR